MLVTTLMNPGRIVNSLMLRREVVRAISSIQVSRRANGKHPAAASVKAFLDQASGMLTAYVEGALPAATVLPAITGTPAVGSTLTLSAGTFTNSTTLTRQWYADQDPVGTNSLTYVPVARDKGKRISAVTVSVGPNGRAEFTTAVTLAVA